MKQMNNIELDDEEFVITEKTIIAEILGTQGHTVA